MLTATTTFRRSSRRARAIAAVVALCAVLLPAALEVAESGAAGPPAGCNLFEAFEPSFVGNDQVAFSAKEPFGSEEDSPRNIYVSDLDGSNRSEIASVSAGTDPTNNRDPVASPDGLSIAWDGIPGGGRSILVSDADGANRVDASAAEIGTSGTNRHPRWSADGSQIVWYNEGNEGIFVANADGTGKTEIASVSANPDPGDNRRPVFNHDATKVAWAGVTTTTLTGSIDPDGTTTVTGVGTTFVTEGVMRGDIIRVNGEERVVDSVGGETTLTVRSVNPLLPAAGFTDTGNDLMPDLLRREIYVADAAGTGRVVISAAASVLTDNDYPDFNHDGSRIAWAGYDGSDYQIYAADSADGMNRITVSTVDSSNDPDDNTTPRFSPNGSQIVWVGDEENFGLANVWVADANGTNRSDITVTPANDPSGNSNPVWSPDGTKISWSGVALHGIQIWVADSDGSNQFEVSDVDDPDFCDNTAPEVTFTTPADGVEYALNQSVTASYSCSDAESGIASCVGDLANGAAVNTSIRGTFSFTVTATNNVGTVKTVTHNYSVDAPAPGPTTPPTTTTILPAGQPDCPNTPTPFTDVPAGSFAAADIRCIYGLGITTGTTATTYSPADNVTREQMASFLARLWRSAGGGCPNTATPFTDVPSTSFAAADVRCIYGLGITTGTTATTYSPADNVTREQMAAFLARVWRGASGSCSTAATPFTDVSPSSFARLDINCIFALGITTGTSATTYSPSNNVTREQMAAFLGRLYREMDDLT